MNILIIAMALHDVDQQFLQEENNDKPLHEYEVTKSKKKRGITKNLMQTEP